MNAKLLKYLVIVWTTGFLSIFSLGEETTTQEFSLGERPADITQAMWKTIVTKYDEYPMLVKMPDDRIVIAQLSSQPQDLFVKNKNWRFAPELVEKDIDLLKMYYVKTKNKFYLSYQEREYAIAIAVALRLATNEREATIQSIIESAVNFSYCARPNSWSRQNVLPSRCSFLAHFNDQSDQSIQGCVHNVILNAEFLIEITENKTWKISNEFVEGFLECFDQVFFKTTAEIKKVLNCMATQTNQGLQIHWDLIPSALSAPVDSYWVRFEIDSGYIKKSDAQQIELYEIPTDYAVLTVYVISADGNECYKQEITLDRQGRIIPYERKVYLILDNLRVHHSKTLTGFLQENAAFIKLFYLPSYSPDLNPNEYLNRDLKSNLSNKPLGRAKGKITEHAKQHMEMIAEQPERIKKLFHSKTVLYAS